ncbi:MAG TPA: flagellar hook-basal body complex protein FliE [Desulfobulbaceae bacterium]|nr:MAG: flagellar hook-basal body complex protein FliE [Deltaproteobacteria bacterium RIFOXYD12_FULL_53_23]HCC53963.1 flagellar hook-basal body complex protein FliE [Desulfobulbaceae bacterium]
MKEITMQPISIPGSSPFKSPGTPGVAGSGFSEILSRSIAEVNGSNQEADLLVKGLAAGEHANIHETMIAMEKSGISFRMMTRVQQKVIDAYREIMRMQL